MWKRKIRYVRCKREQSVFMMRARTARSLLSLLDMFKHFTLLTSSDDRSCTTHHSLPGAMPSNLFYIVRGAVPSNEAVVSIY